MRKRSLHEIVKCYDNIPYIIAGYNFKLTDFAKSYMIATLGTKVNKAVGYRVFSVISHRSRNKIKTNTISAFKGYKNSKSMYNRLKLPRIIYNLRDYFG